MFPNGVLLLALIMVGITVVGAEDKTVISQPMQPGEAVGWLFLCIPLAGLLLAQKTRVFAPRYFIGALPGIAVAFSYWLWRHLRNTAIVSLGIFLLLSTWGVAKQVSRVRDLDSLAVAQRQEGTGQYIRLEDSIRKDGKRFMLFSSVSLYLESEYYSKHPEECVLLRPSDATQQGPGGLAGWNLAPYYPLHIWRLDDLGKHARETALIDPQLETVEAMRQAGFQVVTRFSVPLKVLYLK